MKLGELHKITERLLKAGVPYGSEVRIVKEADGVTVKSVDVSGVMVNQDENDKMHVLFFEKEAIKNCRFGEEGKTDEK